jgi:chromate transporter
MGFDIRSALKVAAIALLLIPSHCSSSLQEIFRFWRGAALFFTKTAFVTILGSYTVIPYVAQLSVIKSHWLTKVQMMDGFALAERRLDH